MHIGQKICFKCSAMARTLIHADLYAHLCCCVAAAHCHQAARLSAEAAAEEPKTLLEVF